MCGSENNNKRRNKRLRRARSEADEARGFTEDKSKKSAKSTDGVTDSVSGFLQPMSLTKISESLASRKKKTNTILGANTFGSAGQLGSF